MPLPAIAVPTLPAKALRPRWTAMAEAPEVSGPMKMSRNASGANSTVPL